MEARQRYSQGLANDQEDREDAIDDVRFAAGGMNQWSPEAISSRKALQRPILTENRLPVFIAQVVNDGRQSKPSIVITALDDGKKATAEMLQGRIRAIEYDSDADIAYDTARECQCMSGRGFFRATTDYEPKTTRQKIKIQAIENQFSVLFGPHKEYDCSDAEWCFVVDKCSPEIFEQRFGKDTLYSQNGFYVDGQNPQPDWIGVGKLAQEIQYAEYWLKVWQNHTVCHLNDGTDVDLEDVPEGAIITEKRIERRPRIMQYILNGIEILDETEWIGSSIPIVPLWGKQFLVDGKRRTFSLIRFAKDPQRLLNIYVSNIAEQIAQMPKSPWLIPVGGITNQEYVWDNLHTDPRVYAHFNQYDLGNGKQLDKPSRIVNEPPIQALVMGYNQAVDAIKASMGLFDASIGSRSNETSGIAINNRKKEADNANFHFHDNEARSRKTLGKIILELIQAIETEEQSVSVRGEDGKTKNIRINTAVPYVDPDSGETIHHQLSVGTYGAAVSTGPNFLSQRDEAFDAYSKIAQADKNFMGVAGDILFANLNAPGSEEIAKRYHDAVIPPQLRKTGGQQSLPPEAQQKIQQMTEQAQQSGQLITALTDHVNKLTADIAAKDSEMASRERIAAMQERTKREIGLATIDQKDAMGLLLADLASVKHRLDLHDQGLQREHEAGMAASAQDHQAGLAQQDQAHQAGLQAGDQAQESDQAEQDRAHQAEQAGQQQQHQAGLQDSAQQATADAAKQAAEAAAAQPEPDKGAK